MSDGYNGISALERRLRALEDAYLVMGARFESHVLACDKRGARTEKLAWTTGGIVLSVLGLLLRAYFHFGP